MISTQDPARRGTDVVPELVDAVVEAARVLAALGLVDAFGHVSARDGDALLITPPVALDQVEGAELVLVPLKAADLPPGAPPETWLHLAIYRARPDVAAIARAQPEATLAVGACRTELAPLHGQAAWLGRRVPVHPVPRLLRTAELAAAAAATLGEADAMVLRGNGAVTTGTGPGIAVARMHLLATACRVHAAARDPVPLDEDDITAWRAAAPPLLARLWLHLARTHQGGNT
ncbi:MAG TPA: class II aldolase/adducin family protein [Nocardioides sp.]